MDRDTEIVASPGDATEASDRFPNLRKITVHAPFSFDG